jgi:hypothetical protein
MTSAAQAYFLSRAISPEAIALYRETRSALIDLIPPEEYLGRTEQVDLVVNVDSLPEMDGKVSQSYFDHIARTTKCFLSINHEILPTTVRDLYTAHGGCQVTRMPYWMRRGYLEEIVTF